MNIIIKFGNLNLIFYNVNSYNLSSFQYFLQALTWAGYRLTRKLSTSEVSPLGHYLVFDSRPWSHVRHFAPMMGALSQPFRSNTKTVTTMVEVAIQRNFLKSAISQRHFASEPRHPFLFLGWWTTEMASSSLSFEVKQNSKQISLCLKYGPF